MNSFYIYRHIRLDSNTPFYVGKGSNKRAHIKSGRNDYWTKIVNKHGYRIEIILSNLTEEVAFEKEKYFIELYKSVNLCEANITLGGEGACGLSVSAETKRKLSKAYIGRYIGKVHTEQSRINMSLGSLGQAGSKGRKYSQQARKNMAIAHGAHKFDVYQAICIEKPVPKLRKSGVYNKGIKIASFLNQNEAAEKLNINQSDISLCLRKKNKQAKGYIFEYVTKDESNG